MAKLLAKRRGRRHEGQLPRLTYAKILTWADQHHRRTGDWPSQRNGPVKGERENWHNIDQALRSGIRGLPGGTSIAGLLAKHRGRPLPNRKATPKR
ncbi:MAG: hypothetical protein IID39_09590 [Planctomycetes bacterium]|nr:hypothetical protein [Planctomycetota bacterium]